MKSFHIYMKRGDEIALTELMRLLHTNFKTLSDYNIDYDTYTEEEIQFNKITCHFSARNGSIAEVEEAIIESLSRAMAEYIVECKEKEVCKEFFKKEQSALDEAQRIQMKEYIQTLLNDRAKSNKINWIADQTKKYYYAEKKLFLEGFIRFRLKNYWDDLRRFVEFARDEYLIEKELSGYIETLKKCVSNRKAKLERLHVIHFDDRNVYLYDQSWNRLYPYLENGVALRLSGLEVNYEDLIVNAIVSLAPKVVIIHTTQENYHIIYTLKKVFSKNGTVCSDCNDCRRRRTAK